jgi:hypothetical protein
MFDKVLWLAKITDEPRSGLKLRGAIAEHQTGESGICLLNRR